MIMQNNNNNNNSVSIARVNTTQACAACKYQRRKCPPDCILGPYFPHDRQRQFLNAHKLFGVSNITKIIRNLDHQSDKDAAMRTIIFQSDVRANDPVGGCYRIVRQLQRQIDYAKAELDIVLHQLALCRAQAQAQAHQQQQQQMLQVVPDDDAADSSTFDIFGADPLTNCSYDQQQTMLNNNYHLLQQCHLQEQYLVQDGNGNLSIQLQEVNSDSWGMQGSISPSAHQGRKQQPSLSECNDFKVVLPAGDDETPDFRFESEDTIERSEVATLKEDQATSKEDEESYQCARDHDLKSAATLFTLTKYDTS